MPELDAVRMSALSQALARCVLRLNAIESRLERIERALQIAPEPPPQPEPTPEPVVPPPVETPPPPPPPPAPPPEPAPAAPPEPAPVLETRLGLTWVNRIGAFTVVLAVAFFFKLAVDNQWIGETGRVALGVLAGLAALGLADFIWKRGHRVYAQGVTAAGIAILYIAFYASFGFYKLLPQPAAFALMALTTVMGGALALRYNAVAISTLALIGGFLTPLLLSTGEDHPWILFPYILLLDAGALAVARFRRWRSLEATAFAGTVLLYGGWLIDRFKPEKRTVATLFDLLYYGLFAAGGAVFFAIGQALASLAAIVIFEAPAPEGLGLLLLLAAAGLAVSEWKNSAGAPPVVFASFWLSSWIWEAARYGEASLAPILAAWTAAFLLFIAWFAWRILGRRSASRKQDLVILALNGVAYFGLSYDLLHPTYQAYLGLFAVAVAAVHLALGWHLWTRQPAEHRDVRSVLLAVGIALGFLTLAAPIQFEGFRITMAWAVEGAALTWIGVHTGARRLVHASLLVLLLALGRLFFLDALLSTQQTLVNVRFLTFLTAAVSLWLAARWIREGALALTPYMAGHVVALSALCLEAVDWAARVSPENAQNLGTASISVLMALYALLLVCLGLFTRAGVNRLLGLGLFALVLLKLYLYDVWQLQRIYRVLAFAVLGGLLLSSSFLYSRFRAKIENWWRDENPAR